MLKEDKDPLSLADTLCGHVIICDEIGCGIVPIDRADENWRESVGRLCCAFGTESRRSRARDRRCAAIHQRRTTMTITFAVLLGFALDWLLGDPKKLPHPVCAVGKLISAAEKVLRRIFPATPASLTFAGILLWLITCGVSFAVPFFFLRWLYHVNFWLGFAAETLFCWMIFARKALRTPVIMSTARSSSRSRRAARPSRGTSAATPQSCPRRALSRPLLRPWLKT